jgi:ABC-type cobalamin transport system permease subunit
MTGALVRIEARHLARSPLLLMGVALGVAAGALELSCTCPPSPATT